MNKHPLRLYEFGPFRLNVTERLLQRSDEVVPLTPKVFDTLLILVENSGHVLGKDELMQALWPDSFVEESSLTQNISLLRRALGELGEERQYIETIPKRGYRFAVGVREFSGSNGEMVVQERTSTQILIEEEQVVHDSQEPVPRSKTKQTTLLQIGRYTIPRMYLAVVAGFVVVVCASVFAYRWHQNRTSVGASIPRSIAVLPFQTIGPQTERELMALGMANALIIKLSALDQTKVLPTSSVSKYVERKQEASLIGKELGVDAVLDGTLQRDGDRVRVTAQMIRSSDGTTVWSGKYDQNYSSIFALQDAISEEVGSALMPNMRKDTRERLASHLTESQEAYEAYVTGLYFWNKRSKDNLPKAIEYLEQAVQKDPKFALAHAYLADCYNLTAWEGPILSSPDSLKRANTEITLALELDDTLVEAHTVKAGLMLGNKDFVGAEQQFRRALELNPNYALAHLRYGYLLFWSLKVEEAVNEMKRAQELDPVSPVANTALAYVLVMSRNYDGAIEKLKKALELQPDFAVARYNLGEAYVQKRMFEEAHAEFEKLKYSDPLFFAEGKAHAYAASGHRAEALRILAELLRSKDRERVVPYDYAVIYAAMGDKQNAFAFLEKESPTRSANAKLRLDPQLDSLRGDKRYDDLVRRRPN